MKHAIMLLTAAVLFAGLLVGCGGGGELSAKAPTLGPVAEEYGNAVKDKDWGKCWDLMSQSDHKQWDNMYSAVKDIPAATPELKIPDDVKDGKTYFVHMMSKTSKKAEETANNVDIEVLKKGYEVVGEEVKDNEGWLKIKNTETGEESKGTHFVKEDGKWKIDMMPDMPKIEMPKP